MGDTPGRSGPPSAETDEIEVFATGSTRLRASDDEATETWHPPVGLDSSPPDDRVRSARGYHARPGHRPGVPIESGRASSESERQGRSTDIVRPLFVDPTLAAALVTEGEVVGRLPYLRMLEPDADAERMLAWPVAVVGRLHRPIPATLHVRASPSMVVTVLELMPTRQLRVGRSSFVAHSVASIEELAFRIERRARAPRGVGLADPIAT